MSTLGLCRPGHSVLHRAPAWSKLVLLLLAGALSVLVDDPWQAGVALAAVVGGYAVAGVPLGVMLRQARPLIWILSAVAVFHVLATWWERAAVVVGVLVALVLLGGLVTLT